MERLASMHPNLLLDTRSPPLVCLKLKILGLFVSVEIPWSQTPVVKLKTLSKCQRWSKSSDLVHIYVFVSETFPWCFNAGSIDWFLKQKSFNGFSLLKKTRHQLLHASQQTTPLQPRKIWTVLIIWQWSKRQPSIFKRVLSIWQWSRNTAGITLH